MSTESYYGHCVIALTKVKINNKEDLYHALSDSYFIETQTGNLIDSLPIYENDFPGYDGFVNTVITNNDLYSYMSLDEKNYEWVGYNDFLILAEEYITKING